MPLRTYRKRPIKELVHFSWRITKTFLMEHRKYGVFRSYRGRGTSHFFTSEVRDYHKVKEGRGNTMERDVSVARSDAERLWGGLYLDLQGMRGIVSLAHKDSLIGDYTRVAHSCEMATRERWFQSWSAVNRHGWRTLGEPAMQGSGLNLLI